MGSNGDIYEQTLMALGWKACDKLWRSYGRLCLYQRYGRFQKLRSGGYPLGAPILYICGRTFLGASAWKLEF